MSTKTGIEWTDATWNPIRGCSRVSEGCRNCYAEKVANRFRGPGQPYEGLLQLLTPKWNGKIKFVEKHLLDPLRWKTPRRIFVNSMSDVFHPNVTDEMLDKIFAVMALCPQHTFQVLTKRPDRMLAYLKGHGASHRRNIAVYDSAVCIILAEFSRMPPQMAGNRSSGEGWWPLPNVWMGVSVESQATADERIPLLLQTPAAVRFLSCEPLLGAIDLTNVNAMVWFAKYMALINPHQAMRNANGKFYPKSCPLDALTGDCAAVAPELQERIDWVICGGESGPGARPMHVDWARSLRDQCVAAGVPFFFKQWGDWEPFRNSEVELFWAKHPGILRKTPTCLVKIDGAVVRPYCMEDAPGMEMVRVGKKAAGCLLDGKEWKQFPEAEVAS